MKRSASSPAASARDDAGAGHSSQDRHRDVVGDRAVEEEAGVLAVLGHHADPCPHRVPGAGPGGGATVRAAWCPGSGLRAPKIVSHSSDRPEPTRPARQTISPARTFDVRLADERCRGEALDLEHDLARPGLALAREQHVPADHQPDELGLVGLGHDARPGDPAVLQDRDPIAELEDLGEAMGDVDDRDARVAQAPDHLEQMLRLGRRQRRGRLVEDQEAEIARERLGDLHDLRLGGRELAYREGRVEGDAEIGEQPLRAPPHLPAIDAA